MENQRKGKHLTGYVADYVVFDLETTGLSPWSDAIIEISAVKVKGGRVADTFSTLVNPGCPIPARASAVNGITDKMVADAPCLKEAMEKFLDFIGTEVLVGHNIHSFDLNFIHQALSKLYGRVLPNDSIDTLAMARGCLPQLSRHRLTDLAAYFHISTEGAHRALNDCVMNQKCFEEMGKLLKAKKVSDDADMRCPRCGGELKLRNGRYGSFYGCGNFPACRYTRNP
ncbi:MAG: exonuclease domain-containing protein [Lachnospiraceae bacterium]|nr:exonuclease domain-containing protein [Lachnospiraceae bacterium]